MDKLALFLAGRWTAPEPGIDTMFWSFKTWIFWIDAWGEWQA